MTYVWSQMSPRERDALVAERVMGLEIEDGCLSAYPKYWLPEFDHVYLRNVPNYSTEISTAWEVAEKKRITVNPIYNGWEAGYCNASGFRGDIAWVGMTNHKKWSRATTAPEAICLAALRAVGVEV